MAHDLKPEEFPVGKWTVSFDEDEGFWVDMDRRDIPKIMRFYYHSNWLEGLDILKPGTKEKIEDISLLCFCDSSV